jgi:nucleotide-binding universal stress UspA family protein
MRIIVATDGSRHAEVALRLVTEMEWPVNTAFRVVTVVDDPIASFGVAPDELIETEISRALEGPIAKALGAIGRQTVLVEGAVLRGRTGTAILAHAADWGADLIVVGHRGLGTVRALLLGSVAAEIVERATVPVLVARADVLGPVVLGDDGSPPARAARQLIARWPALRRQLVRVVSVAHVSAPLGSGIAPTMRRAAAVAYADDVSSSLAAHAAIAEEAAGALRSSGVAASAEAATGDPATEIVATAEETGARLIVVGSRGRGGIAALLGSVARAVVLRAPCSVLVVHASKEANT